MRKRWYQIPIILKSFAEIFRKGGTWHDVAKELYQAGWTSYVNEAQAKRIVTKYLNQSQEN